MTTAPPSRSRASYTWLTVAILAVTSVYAWYVMGQYQRLNELNQHELASAGAELKRAIENAVDSTTTFTPDAVGEGPLCVFDENQPYLTREGGCHTDSSRPSGTLGRLTLTGATLLTQPSVAVEVRIRETHATHATDIGTARFRIRIDTLLQELSFPESFQLILVARPDGQILYQDAPADRRLTRRLRWGEQHFRDSTASSPAGVTITNLASALGESASPSWTTLRAASTLTSLQLGGVWHRIYLQPLTLERGNTEGLVLAGAVPSSTLVRDALAVDATFVAGLVFVVLLGVLGFPFVKLASLDRHERFRLIDVARLYLSTAALVALFTVAVFGVDARWRWQAVADDGLATLANRLARHFTREVVTLRDELVTYDAQVAQWGPRECGTQWPAQVDWFTGPPAKAAGRTTARVDVLPLPTQPVDIEQVAWIRSGGTQMWKATNRNGGKVNVANRPYFAAVRDGHLYLAGRSPVEFFISPDRSISDGQFYTFISTRSSIAKGFCLDAPGDARFTAVTTARLLSLDRVPLPTGYGFALINREGRVLYHSDGRLSLRENIFEQLGDASRMRALMYSSRSDTFEVPYRKRAHRFHVRPIAVIRNDGTSAGLAIATFRDTSIERDVVARVFLVGLGGPVVLGMFGIAATMVLLSAVARRVDGRWTAWMWPHGGHASLYRQASLALLVIFIVGLTLSIFDVSYLVVLLIPAVAVASAVLLYFWHARQRHPRLPLRAQAWHTTMLVLILACIVVLPGVEFFRMALRHELGSFVAAETAWLEDQADDVQLALRAEARREGYPEAIGDRLANRRAAYFDPTPPAPFGTAQPASPHDELLRVALHTVERVLPIEDETMARQRFASPEEADDVQPVEALEPVYSPPASAAGTTLVVVGIGTVILALLGWTRWSTSRILLAPQGVPDGSLSPTATLEEVWNQCSDDQRCLLLQVNRERLANPYQHKDIRALLHRGLLTLAPDLRPASEAFEAFLHEREQDHARALHTWEHVDTSHSWHHMRLVLVASIGAAAFFLVATQPGLQTGLLGIATGITGVLTTASKLRDAAWGWITRPKAGGTET